MTTEIEGMTGRTLFPSPQAGSWPPFETLVESVSTGPWTSDLHSHAHEEVVNYVVSGTLIHDDDTGRRVQLPESAVTVLSTQEERRHDVAPAAGVQTRWLALAVWIPKEVTVPAPYQHFAERSPSRDLGQGILGRDLVGLSSQIHSAVGLELFEAQFTRRASWEYPIAPERRAVVYALDGAGSVQDVRLSGGGGVLLEGVPRIAVVAEPGFRFVSCSVPV